MLINRVLNNFGHDCIFDRVSSSLDDEWQPIFRRKNLDVQEEGRG